MAEVMRNGDKCTGITSASPSVFGLWFLYEILLLLIKTQKMKFDGCAWKIEIREGECAVTLVSGCR